MLRPKGSAGGKVGHRQTPCKVKDPQVKTWGFFICWIEIDLLEALTTRAAGFEFSNCSPDYFPVHAVF
jgi:hypothetical protein